MFSDIIHFLISFNHPIHLLDNIWVHLFLHCNINYIFEIYFGHLLTVNAFQTFDFSWIVNSFFHLLVIALVFDIRRDLCLKGTFSMMDNMYYHCEMSSVL